MDVLALSREEGVAGVTPACRARGCTTAYARHDDAQLGLRFFAHEDVGERKTRTRSSSAGGGCGDVSTRMFRYKHGERG